VARRRREPPLKVPPRSAGSGKIVKAQAFVFLRRAGCAVFRRKALGCCEIRGPKWSMSGGAGRRAGPDAGKWGIDVRLLYY